MKILFVSQYFYPELFRGNDIAFDFAKKGHDVTVIAGIPNYPHGKYFNGYGLFKKNKETINKVKVIRIPLISRGQGSGFRLMLNYLSFALFASLYVFFLSFYNKFDRIFVQQLSPVTMSLPGVIVKKIQKIPLYIWVLDLWPESLISAGGSKNKFIIGFFNYFVKLQYKNANKILVSSRGFIELIHQKGYKKEKIVHFPNWAESVFTSSKEIEIPKLPNGFIVMFAGNIGEAQDFENILEAAKLINHEKSIHFVFIGNGRKKEWSQNFVESNKLNETVHFMGHYPISSMPSFFNKASVMLIALKDALIFNLTAPAKLQAYMAAGKPVVGMLNGDGAEIINVAKCGLVVRAGDSKSLADIILNMSKMSKNELDLMGNNGKLYCENHFDKTKCLNRLSEIMQL